MTVSKSAVGVDVCLGPTPTVTPLRCASEACDRRVHARGLCEGHYVRLRSGREVDTPIGPATKLGEKLPRLSWDALADAARRQYRPRSNKVTVIGDVGIVARLTGVDRVCVHRWRRGGVPLSQADRVADGLGVHPAELWPEWIDLVAS